ncbi:MAG: hypothetical protein ACYDCE_16120 [Candidatus Acidiferrales bacterium]
MSQSGLLCNVCYYTDNDVIYTLAAFEIDGQLLCPKHFTLLGDDTPVTYRTRFHRLISPSDNGAAALAHGIAAATHCGGCDKDAMYADAILGDRGVFLPEGLKVSD